MVPADLGTPIFARADAIRVRVPLSSAPGPSNASWVALGLDGSVGRAQPSFAARACASRSSTSGSIAGGIGIVAFTGPIG